MSAACTPWRLLPMAVCLTVCVWSGRVFAAEQPPLVRVGSKSFTESYILGEIIAQIIEQAGDAKVERKLGLGGTGITYRALASGAIDIYPEYTGTLSRAILKDPAVEAPDKIRQHLLSQGLTISDPLGFNNTYALAVRRQTAAALGLKRLSDLQRHPEFRAAFSSGFSERDDGWPGLRRHYRLQLKEVTTMDHTLTYDALVHGKVDVIDAFSTDGKLQKLNLSILQDDQHFFPSYHAVLFVRLEFIKRFPRTWEALQRLLVNQLDDATMTALNALVEFEGHSVSQASRLFLQPEATPVSEQQRLLRTLVTLTGDHLLLVVLSLGVAVLLGVPLGIVAAKVQRLGQVELMSIGVLQTIPALALLCFMIPLFGIGQVPALVALSLYALLPIVRNTYTGIVGIDPQLLDIAGVLGLNNRQRLWRIELPLAALSITAGVKTSAIFTVGTATLAAFIGGGGYGTLIMRGLALDDISTIMAGAIPAALMALAMHGLFELGDRLVIPKGLWKETTRAQ